MKRPPAPSIGFFVMWSAAMLVLSTAIDGLLQGRGLTAFVEAIFGFIWVGWIAVVAAIPLWVGFRWVLGRLGSRLVGRTRWRGAAVGLVWWSVVGMVVLGVQLLTWPYSPDSEPTVSTAVRGLAGIGAFGLVLGFLEGRAIERRHVTSPNAH